MTTGGANVILSRITYIDAVTCGAGLGVPTATTCGNLNSWAFTQQLTIGNSALRRSTLGTPDSTYQSTVDGTIPIINADNSCGYPCDITDRVWNSNLSNDALNAYFETTSAASTPLPSGQYLCIAEATALGFNLAPFFGGVKLYSFNVF